MAMGVSSRTAWAAMAAVPCDAEQSCQLPSDLESVLPSPGICQRDKHLDHQQILLYEAPRQCSLGFLLGCHGVPGGWAVWSQAGVNQVDVLGGTKLPAEIRGSLLSDNREQHFGFTAQRGKLRQGWGEAQDPSVWSTSRTGPRHQSRGLLRSKPRAKARTNCQFYPVEGPSNATGMTIAGCGGWGGFLMATGPRIQQGC